MAPAVLYISMSFVKNLIVPSQMETKGAESGLLE